MSEVESLEVFKKHAGEKACEGVRSGMCVGLGTGTTAKYVILRLAELVKTGKLSEMSFVSTSDQSTQLVPSVDFIRLQAQENGLTVSDVNDVTKVDLVIDGADEVDSAMNLVKGRGGALLREKIIAEKAEKMIVVVDHTKMVTAIGMKPVPVEVVPFGHMETAAKLRKLGCTPVLRMASGATYITNNGNYIYDCLFDCCFSKLGELAAKIKGITGVVDHGLFVGLARMVICATKEGINIYTSS